MSQDTPAIAPWKGPALVCVVLAAAALLYWPGTLSLGELWSDTTGDTYTSGFLIAAVSLWLLWRQRAQLVPSPLPARQCLAALALLAGAALIWQFALRAGIQVVYLTLLPFLWWLCVALVCGRRAARATAFPLGFLIFALPIWDYLIPLLQWLTVHVVRLALRVTGVPSYFKGEYVQIPAGIFQIQGGCSGLHYFIVGLAIAVLLGELRRDDWRVRLQLILVGGALAILSNWIRVFSIILAGHLSHMQSYLVRVSHYSYGWFVFLATLILFFFYAWHRARDAAPGAARAELPWAGAAFPGYAWLGLVAVVAGLPAMLNLVISARLPHAGALPAAPLAAVARRLAGERCGSLRLATRCRSAPTRCAAGVSRAAARASKFSTPATWNSGSARNSVVASTCREVST